MSRYLIMSILIIIVVGCKQKDTEFPAQGNENSLLWKVSGNGLKTSSYLYGTVHIICNENAELSENFRRIISRSDAVYFEVDMDNFTDIMSAMEEMKMRGDTTLQDLLDERDYEKIKEYIDEIDYIIPFSELESYHPILTSAILYEKILGCDETTGVEEVITEVAEKHKKPTLGLESLEYQLNLLDSVPYEEQAKQLVDFIDSVTANGGDVHEVHKVYEAYQEQDLDRLEKLIFEMDPTLSSLSELLLYRRNQNWVVKLKELMQKRSLVIAVGAAHLPGEKGVINLLRKEGYEVTAIKNDLPLKKKKD